MISKNFIWGLNPTWCTALSFFAIKEESVLKAFNTKSRVTKTDLYKENK